MSNCIETEDGSGYCDYCANGKPELCRYMNTVGAMKRIAELGAQVEHHKRMRRKRRAYITKLKAQLAEKELHRKFEQQCKVRLEAQLEAVCEEAFATNTLTATETLRNIQTVLERKT